MIIRSMVSQFGRITLEIVGESDHEDSLLTIISQKAFEGSYLNETAGTNERSATHMILNYVNPVEPSNQIPENLGRGMEPQVNLA